jgi:molybdate transport system substrate-binding protein
MRGVALAQPVTVYAAASLTSVLQELSKIAEINEVSWRSSFGSSSTLAKQIAQGAPADVYFSANVNWMAFLAEKELIEPGTQVNLLGNALVVIAPEGEGFEMRPSPDFDFASAFQGRLSLGDPSHVPAGMYAKEALEKLGWWDAVKGRLAPAADARAALTLVARGECPAGIVYVTDAAMSNSVVVIATFPDSLLRAPIVYPMAVVKGRLRPKVKATIGFFQSKAAAAVFQRHGFRVFTTF